MKMYYGNVPIKSLNSKSFETNTNDATVQASDMQAGLTGYARGQKITGTGKAFEFATYGKFNVNRAFPIPVADINTIIVSSVDGAVKMTDEINNLRDFDFSTAQEIAKITLNSVEYPLTVQITSNGITFGCAQDTFIQAMIGKDNFI